jgi:hypothetical protein
MREVNELPFLPLLVERLAERSTARRHRGRAHRSSRPGRRPAERRDRDFAFDVGLPLSHDVRRERVTSEPLAVLARKDHPSIDSE